MGRVDKRRCRLEQEALVRILAKKGTVSQPSRWLRLGYWQDAPILILWQCFAVPSPQSEVDGVWSTMYYISLLPCLWAVRGCADDDGQSTLVKQVSIRDLHCHTLRALSDQWLRYLRAFQLHISHLHAICYDILDKTSVVIQIPRQAADPYNVLIVKDGYTTLSHLSR
ncbi:hypothetical protein PILCRDRAFT_637754 [Piloderma croceum F 1598]|uniref:Uncharacterized protein n=1 Tax=Piloderma croceum (strain F 1598) TaxID=765440 RepID=A0A0C3ASA8_PILCF|nr:hypothetical protein PILCRDRAFT_637754 [Piloderma croceum F 1598]